MCGPWALPLAFVLGGSGMQYLGAQKAEHAQLAAYNAEHDRQQRFTAEQDALWRDSLDRAGDMAGADHQAEATARRLSPLQAAIIPAGRADYLPGSSSAAPVVKVAADRAGTAQRGASAGLAEAMARMGGFGDQLFDTSIMNARNAGRIGQTASFMAGSAAANEAEMRAAANKGSTLRGLGSLATAIGGAMMGAPGFGMGGAGAGAGKSALVAERVGHELNGFPSWADILRGGWDGPGGFGGPYRIDL